MSGLTELPSTAATSLGPAKEDRLVYMNETFRAQAFLINKIRTYLIQMGEMLGLGDDSTPGSLGYRLAAVEAALAVPAPVKLAGATQQEVTILGAETVIGSFGAFAPALYASPVIALEATLLFAPATSGTAEVRLYDVGTRTTPTAGTLRGTITVTAFDAGVRKCVSLALTVTPTPGVNTATISDAERIYELRAILLGAASGDALTVDNVSLSVTGTATGGTFAPTNAAYLALAASAALSDERVMTPADSLQGTDGGPGGTYQLRLVNDAPAPGTDMQYATDSAGVRGWYPRPLDPVIWEWNGVDLTQFAADNPLPAPGYTAGVVVAPTLTVVPSVEAVGGTVLRMSAASVAVGGSAIWWIDLPVTLGPMTLEIEVAPPVTTLAPTDTAAMGSCYAGDLAGYAVSDLLLFDAGSASLSRLAVQSDPLGATLLMSDALTQMGYVVALTTKIRADRGNTAGFPPLGVPRISAEAVALPFIPPPSAATAPQGLLYVTNSALFPPSPGWGASTCNRVGLVLGGGNNGFSTPNAVDILKFRILRG